MFLSLRKLLPVALLFVSLTSLFAQTSRGTVNGVVTDKTGAAIAGSEVQLVNPATGATLKSVTSGAGEFNFTEIPAAVYILTVSHSGFQTRKIEGLDVAVTKTVNVPVKLDLGAENTVVNVEANAIQTDTTSSALIAVIDSKSVQEMPMNGRNFTQMVKFAPGVGALTNSVNGSRTASINFQVDGADNVDPWLGIVASNQGGIAGVAGGLIPVEAIDQFSMQSGGEADQGRNAGANSNMVIKSGTNNIHGDVFYFDRNEFFAALSPVQAVGSRKSLIRNHQGGFTIGGPIVRDRTFLFLAGEIQVAKANTAVLGTAPSDAWITQSNTFLGNWGINQGSTSKLAPNANQLSTNLYNLLYPANSKGGAAITQNYFANGTSNYNSFNGIVKLDHRFSDKQSLSVRYLGTTGKQTAPTTSDYADYFQTAPMHIHNFSIVHSYIFTPRVLNTVTFATNYFLQTFNDANQNFNPQANAGLTLGLTPGTIIAAGSPTITITGFETVGATQPSGRTDVTGHVTDNFHWTIGRHDLKIGGEYRHSNVNQLYFSSARGTFAFDGTRGPWYSVAVTPAAKTACATTSTGAACAAACAVSGACTQGSAPNALATAYCATQGVASCTNLSTLSDFLNGQPSNSAGARLLQGNAQRVWTLDTEDFWVQDNFKATRSLSLNYGVRYTIPGVIHAAADDIYQFVPGTTPGFQKGYYPNYYGGVAPRVGFSYQPFEGDKTVVRGSYGLFYDFPAMSSWITGTTTNSGANYAQNNPAGADAAAIFSQTNVQWATGANPFAGGVAPQVGAFGVNQNFKMPRSSVVSFNVEQQLSKSTLLSVGYVGTFGRHLEVLYDLNQPIASGTGTANARPYDAITTYPNQNAKFAGKPLLGINQLNFAANSNYHGLQATVRQTSWKGLITTFNYTWSKAMDTASSNTTPMNSYNLKADYGPSTFDNRHLFNGYVYYNLPKFTRVAPRITQGYQMNALVTMSTGTPISPQYSTNVDGTGELKDRPNWSGISPYVGGVQTETNTGTGRTYRQLSKFTTAFSTPSTGTYGNLRRDAFSGPSFKTIDFSLFKKTPVSEKVMSEFRVEIFNILNFNNFANPTVNPTSSSFGVITNTRNASSAPGIGVGEPFNIQFALKISF